MKPAELENLIRKLSGSERERVRGYVEAILEQRAHAEAASDQAQGTGSQSIMPMRSPMAR